MTSVRLPKDLEQRLHTVALKTNRTKSYYLIKSIRTFLDQNEKKLLFLADLQHNKLLKEPLLKTVTKHKQDL